MLNVSTNLDRNPIVLYYTTGQCGVLRNKSFVLSLSFVLNLMSTGSFEHPSGSSILPQLPFLTRKKKKEEGCTEMSMHHFCGLSVLSEASGSGYTSTVEILTKQDVKNLFDGIVQSQSSDYCRSFP